MKVTVSQTNIEKGRRMNSMDCPIVRAIRDLGYCDVYVDYENVVFTSGSLRKRADLSKRARAFIHQFDAGKRVKPFTFIAKEYHV